MSSVNIVRRRHAELQNLWNIDFGRRSALEDQAESLRQEVDTLTSEAELINKVLTVYHRLDESIQEYFLAALERLVTAGIQAIFQDEISFHIRPKVRGNQVTMDFVLKNPDGSETDLIGSRGGGLISIIGVVLQIVTIRLMQDKIHQVLVLDEPFSHLSAEYVEPCANFLRKLSDDLDVQIIMVTHQPEFLDVADKAYRLTQDSDGWAVANEIGSASLT